MRAIFFLACGATAIPGWLFAQDSVVVHRGSLAGGDRRLRSGEFYDAYSFEGRAGQRVVLDLQSSAFNPYLMVTAPSGVRRANEDWRGSRQHSRMELTLEEVGTYAVTVTSNQVGEKGAYELRIEAGGTSVATAAAPATATPVPQAAAPQTPPPAPNLTGPRSSGAVGLRVSPLRVVEAGGHHPRWSPDGSRLYYHVCAPGKACEIKAAAASGGTVPRSLAPGRNPIPSRDGRRVAYIGQELRRGAALDWRQDLGWWVYDLTTGKGVPLPVGDRGSREEDLSNAQWTRDGRFILGDVSNPNSRYAFRLDMRDLRYADLDPDTLQRLSLESNPNVRLDMGFFLDMRTDPSGLDEIESALGGDLLGMRGVYLINTDVTYGRLLFAGGTGVRAMDANGPDWAIQLSPDAKRLAVDRYDGARTDGVYITTITMGPPVARTFEVDGGLVNGLMPGDVLYVRPPRVNPISGEIVGFGTDTRVVLGIVSVDSTKGVARVIFEWGTEVKPGDLGVVARSETWFRLRALGEREWDRDAPELVYRRYSSTAVGDAVDFIRGTAPDRPALVREWKSCLHRDSGEACFWAGRRVEPEAAIQILMRLRYPGTVEVLGQQVRPTTERWMPQLPPNAAILALGDLGDQAAISYLEAFRTQLKSSRFETGSDMDRAVKLAERSLARLRTGRWMRNDW